ncbi:MAG: hypothetical protein HZA47_05000 [Planctomycetes bacterium]|uniref:hypothetical protein n=1 Tax=Candidatus Wunengus sp. YC65 TaxID=3367701 RepID=UPI001D5725DC|nr:hypothetical protein [Planctomycetota bacterium]
MRYIFISLFMSAVFLGIGPIHVNAQEQSQTQEQTEGEQEFALTDKPLEIWTFIDDYRVITGKTLHLTVQVMWKLGITVNLEGVDKIDLSPCRIEGVTIGERQIFDNEHDYIVITYTLSLPSNIGEGIYSIPSFTLSYRNEVDKTEGKSTSSPVAIKKVPILVEGKVNKDVITIGDQINYALTIRHEKNVRVIWENIEKLNFSPFDILKKDVEKTTEGNIEKILINYTLSLYEVGGKKKTPEIPELTILYYKESQTQSGEAKSDTSLIETKEAKVDPIPIIVNSLLKAVDVPLEGLKGPLYYSKKDVFLRGYVTIGIGVALLLFLGVTALRSMAGRLSPISPKPVTETPKIALERLQHAVASFQFAGEEKVNRTNIQDINKSLRTYIGTLLGISNEAAQSVTTSDFFNYDTQKRLTGEISTTARTVLKQIDTVVYGRQIKKEMIDKILQGIEEIIKQTSPMFVKH